MQDYRPGMGAGMQAGGVGYRQSPRKSSPTPGAASTPVRANSPRAAVMSPDALHPEVERNRAEREADKSGVHQRHWWAFTTIPHDTSFVDARIHMNGTKALHPAPKDEDENCLIAVNPPTSKGVHKLNARLHRPHRVSVQFQGNHYVQLIPTGREYNKDTSNVSLMLPAQEDYHVQLTMDHAAGTFSMRGEDGKTQSGSMDSLGFPPPYQVVFYLWDAESYVTILPEDYFDSDQWKVEKWMAGASPP